jgi:hypothetical protein
MMSYSPTFLSKGCVISNLTFWRVFLKLPLPMELFQPRICLLSIVGGWLEIDRPPACAERARRNDAERLFGLQFNGVMIFAGFQA